MAAGELERQVEAARRFNRFYTRQIGVLRRGAYHSPFSLTEVRVLYELAHREQPTATELGRDLGLDAGYLSRMLRGFEKRALVAKTRSAADGRRSHLALTGLGRKVFAPLNTRSHDEVAALLGGLDPAARAHVVAAMQTIERLLGRDRPHSSAAFLLRAPQPGDMGWVVHRHGVVYAGEYGYDAQFEALVAEIVARFARRFDPKRERCWIAEQDGAAVGSVFLVERSKTVAQLRLLLVEPQARGSGLGTRLVAECVRFARQTGYRKVMLWTQSELRAARRLYQAAGFRIVRKERNASFGKALVSETWELDLTALQTAQEPHERRALERR
ncbi:MAG TPA: helix-turn-helix domain-containing GNAT family N-acetyltransferase [Gemmatimonadales bacterium]|nr:helix-turn-helix domain-containing GNAT family N-acetyltransferase [Gemmatimonadales bacterium]